jgi:hypothetical protein
MKKAIVIFVTVLLALFFCCELKASNFQKSIVPAEAEWVIHFDLEKFAATQVGEYLLNEKGAFKLMKKNDQFKKRYQINILEDIDGITVLDSEKARKKQLSVSKEILIRTIFLDYSQWKNPTGKSRTENTPFTIGTAMNTASLPTSIWLF